MVINRVVGERIRRRRQELGLTLRELARRIGMTAGYLSRVENQQITPSLDALQAIAAALRVPMFYFLESAPNEPVVRAGARRRLSFPDSHLAYELLTPANSGQLMAVLIRLEPGARRVTPPLVQPNEQMMFVLEGRLMINVDGTTYTLDKHDSIYYNGNLLREFACVGDRDVVVLCVIVPPVL
ncbi:MAG: helix-turn-helix domain-containing protein [Anaerolineae bacterium]